MMFSPDTTVGELAATFPAAVKVFQRRKVEFCCGGTRTLWQLCQDTDTSFAILQAELEQAINGAPPRLTWADRPLSELTAHIVDAFHDPLRQELPRLRQLVAKLERHGESNGRLLTALHRVLLRFESLLLARMAVEEASVFPLIGALETGCCGPEQQLSLAGYQQDADRFRRDARWTMRMLRAMTGDYLPPPTACPTWRALYRALEEFEQLMQLHVHLETNVLFERAASIVGGLCVEKES
jgi:regulator of cell morphogenesis and NO signaling